MRALPSHPSVSSRRVRGALASCSVLGLAWVGTYAAFTDDAVAESVFTAGEVDIVLANETDDAYAFTDLSVDGLKPGTVKYAALPVNNAGDLAFDYTLKTTTPAGDALASALTLAVNSVAGTTCDAASYGAGTAVVAEGSLAVAPASTARSLAGAASETLCFKVALPSDADNALQGQSTTATFTFDATQQ